MSSSGSPQVLRHVSSSGLQSCFCYPRGAWSLFPLLQLVHQTPKRSPWPCRFHPRRLFRTFISPWRSHLCKLPRYLPRINSTSRRLGLYCLPRVPCETTPTALHLGRASCYSNCLLSVLPRSWRPSFITKLIPNTVFELCWRDPLLAGFEINHHLSINKLPDCHANTAWCLICLLSILLCSLMKSVWSDETCRRNNSS